MMLVPLTMLLQATGSVPADVPQQRFGAWLLTTLIKMLAVFTVYMIGVALLTLAERKLSAWIQGRLGPNRVGPGGIGQPFADGLKNIMKEETYPQHAYMPLFVLAPALSFIPALITWAVIPFGAPWDSPWGRIDMALAPLPVGFLYVLAISSLGVYGIVLAGWSSNNKYALLGGLRSSAQMVSYEIAMGMSTIPVLLLAGNVALDDIVAQQAALGWNVLLLTLAFLIFMIALFAETNRLPFDLPEAESELITGYHTEYSAMKFSFFFIAEYANMVTGSALMATLFFGGWDIPLTAWDNTAPHTGIKTAFTALAFLVKILIFVFLFMWVRWTLPRFRYDQLMALGWKILLPLSLAYIVIIASLVLALEAIGVPRGWMYGAALFGVNLVIMLVVVLGLDRGRIISPATTRIDDTQLGHLRARLAHRSAHAEVGD
jgi:NADH-quinone oxidoreductase subunit H